MPCSVTMRLAISSTRLYHKLATHSYALTFQSDSRFETNNIADTMTLVTDGSADLTNRVDELDTHHPLSGGQLNLTSKVVNVLDQRSQNDTSTVGSVGSHSVDDIGSEVGVKSCVG